ncbi:ketopantoate reductase family protein [Paraglaciecola aestuariivivens]
MAHHQTASSPIAIVGQGAIGGLIGYRCHQLNLPYAHLLRHTSALPQKVTNLQGELTELPAKTLTKAQLADCELIILPIKAYQVIPALTELTPFLASQQTLVLLHNGMGTIHKVKSLCKQQNLVAGTTSDAAFKPQANSLNETGRGQAHFGWITQTDPKIKQTVSEQLNRLFPQHTWHADIEFALWKKLAINALINPLTALNNIKNGQLAESKFYPLIQNLCLEISKVMQALDYPVTATELEHNVMQVVHATANNYSSMHQDFKQNRPTEIDFINGYVVEQAKQLNLAVPENLALYQQIKQLEHNKKGT